jgi:very-short-patch-repair endonuclease
VEPAAAAKVFTQQRIRQVRDAMAAWSAQLINLDGQNRLLFYRDLKTGTLDLSDADPTAVDALLAGRAMLISQMFADAAVPDRLGRARAIRNKTRELLEERGIATCFLAVGMAAWTNPKGTAKPAAPVLLHEAVITARGAAESDFDLALTGEVDVNPALLHMLKTQFSVEVAEDDLLATLPDGIFNATSLFQRLTKEAGSVPGFAIEPRHVLGNFSYAKMPMVGDLQKNLDAMIAHEVIAAIAGDSESQSRLAGPGRPVDPRHVDRIAPSDECLVLDADSSQSYAINAAVAGQSLVVSGPPGTGKSQTIANLIATLVARGKSVLFVAEKRAAISAVLGRLSSVGLDDLVLDLHGGAGSRRKVAENLAATFRASGMVARPDQSALHEQLVYHRNLLNAHSVAVNGVREHWGVSVFDAKSALLGLEGRYGRAAAVAGRLSRDSLMTLDAGTFRRVRDQVREFAGLGAFTLDPARNPWTGGSVLSAEQARDAQEMTDRLYTQTLPETRSALDRLLEQVGLRPPDSLARWQEVLGILDSVAHTLSALDKSVFTGPLQEMVAATAGSGWRRKNRDWPGSTAGWFARRKTRKITRKLWIGSERPGRAHLHQCLAAAFEQQSTWVRVSVDGQPPRIPDTLDEAHGRYEQLTRELAALGAFLLSGDLGAQHPAALSETVHRLRQDESTLRKLPRLHELDAELRRFGLGPMLVEMGSRRLDAELAVAAFENCWYSSIVDRVGFDDQTIATFNSGLHNTVAQVFRASDSGHIDQAAARVRRAAAENLVAARDLYRDETRLVEAQASRKTRHLPLRDLFSAAPNVMTHLKPCWAMSPLVVSQLLPGDRPYFDVVVFDEASQIEPADAVPAILRARQVIVAGDKHQLPPTSFFSSVDGGDDGGSPVIEDDGSINVALTSGYESILDVLTGALGKGRVRSLTWHYRSHDERLIAFSNGWIYDRSLTTFPGVAGAQCLRHVLVEQVASAGQEDSVTAEVDTVVQEIFQHARSRPDESLGVITMGIKHADRVDAALRRALTQHPELNGFFEESRQDKFFVKNLERVQGDERDAIILSIGYGKSPDGRLPYRFGPLLREGGQRRLNVAITRARSRMTVVSSFSHRDMDPGRSNAAGVQMLRRYLQYASSGGTDLGDVWREKPPLNPFEIAVRDRLLAAGIPVTAQYGVAGFWIDFAAAHPSQPGRMVLAIEADGASYHSSISARDRDRLRQEQLERLGWTFHRIWSTDWFADADTCIAKLKVAYDRAVTDADKDDTGNEADLGVVHREPDPVGHDARRTAQAPARRGHRPPARPGLPITEYTDAQLVAIIRWIESDTLLRTKDQVLTEFMDALGFRKRGSRIVAAFERAFSTSRR